jgi:hypothetical protein
MSVMEMWQANNERYLSAALSWLRLKLRRHAESFATPAPRGCNPFRRGNGQTEHISDKQLETAVHQLAEAEKLDPPPALILLSKQFRLSSFERNMLLLCAALELDTSIAGLCARAQDNPVRPYPTFALGTALFDDPAWDAMAAERPLRYWRLIEINQPTGQPLTVSALNADERIVNYLKGLNEDVDDRLRSLVSPMSDGDAQSLPESQRAVVEQIKSAFHVSPLPIVQFVGRDSLSKQLVAKEAVRFFGLTLFRLSNEWMPTSAGELETFIRLWQRETMLLPVGLYVEAQGDSHSAALQRVVEQVRGPLFLDTVERWSDLSRVSVVIETARPTPEEQEAEWLEILGEQGEQAASELANQFNFNLPTIRQVAATAMIGGEKGLRSRLWEGCLTHSRRKMDTLAQRIDVKAQWDDLILPTDDKNLLCQIVSQVRLRNVVYKRWNFRQKMNRGLGVTALFAGESGTGKTMAAEVIANDLQLNLYKIDLSTVVSKYIGETEKNLAVLFDEATTGGMVLFFDEADSLFGKRSEVKDSHDRYANIEINYLLQRMESFEGLAILATNMKSALDTAFMRRLRFVVNFPFPGRSERKSIWEKAFPQPQYGLPPSLDYEWLARFNLTGGNIHTIALNAAFLAEQRGTAITMPLVLEVTRTEFRKLEKPMNEADFRWVGG